ncbi:MAG: hypothetical protein P4L87_10540 [Formivibrio sp.]|nr:hypothetical protein [Formivibrio sp.]
MAYSFPAISVQYHPEFTAEYTKTLAEKFRGELLPDQVSANALESVHQLPVDAAPIAKWVAGFFQRHING